MHRRQALAEADAAVGTTHDAIPLAFNVEGVEQFPLVFPAGILDKGAKAYLIPQHELRWKQRLIEKRMEGVVQRTHSPPAWKTGCAK
jgi:hypothetical protein